MQTKLDFAMQDVNAKYQQLEELEKNSVRTALIEERGRFCLFISCIKPFVVRTRHSLPSSANLAHTFLSSSLRFYSPPHCQPLSFQLQMQQNIQSCKANLLCRRRKIRNGHRLKWSCLIRTWQNIAIGLWSGYWLITKVKMIMLWLELDKPLACEVVIHWLPLCCCQWTDYKVHLLTQTIHLLESAHYFSPNHHRVVVDRITKSTCWHMIHLLEIMPIVITWSIIITVLLTESQRAHADTSNSPTRGHVWPVLFSWSPLCCC